MTPLEPQNIVNKSFNKKTRPTLELSLAESQREVARLQQLIIQIKTDINICSAISSLPLETLSKIFMLCCQPKYNAIGGLDSQGICPLRLAAVCKAWRELAWITSRLWSYIFLIKPNPHAPHLEEVLISWLDRSGNHPLSIRYDAKYDIALLPRLYSQAAARWVNVSIFLPEEFFDVIRNCSEFRLLEHLSMHSGPSP